MKYIIQFFIILLLLFVGNLLSDLMSSLFLIPGPIIGMILLFSLLQFKVIKLEHIEGVTTYMFSIITLFFLPSGISLMNYLNIIYNNFVPIIFIGTVVTIISLAITMKFTDILYLIVSRGEKHD